MRSCSRRTCTPDFYPHTCTFTFESHLDTVLNFIALFAALSLFYPLYNTVKRVVKSSDYFALSSICNNGFEWSVGFILGSQLGMCLEICWTLDKEKKIKAGMAKVNLTDELTELENMDGNRITYFGSICMIVALIITTVMFLVTWRPDGSFSTLVMVLLVVLIWLITLYWVKGSSKGGVSFHGSFGTLRMPESPRLGLSSRKLKTPTEL